MEWREVRFKALPKQKTFLRSEARYALYSGAVGSGKTTALCLRSLMRACMPGAREGLCRKYLSDLKATTLKTLLEGDGGMPPILPPGTYEHHKSDKIIRIHGGGEICYFGIVDASESKSKIGSRNLTGCGIDQAEELAVADWSAINDRCRVPVAGLNAQVYAACNPGPPSHFLAERFGLALGHQCWKDHEAVTTAAADNTHLPPEYLASLNLRTGLAHKRFVLGLWVGSDGLVYDRWDRSAHVRDDEREPGRVIIGVDDGYTNPFVALRCHIDGDGRIHIAEEVYERNLVPEDRVERIKALAPPNVAESVIVDPSAADLIEMLRRAGYHVIAANNEVFDGIGRVQQRLELPGDGRYRLTVDPRCRNTMTEFETYEWKDGKDEPIKTSDHAMDAIRYVVAQLDGASDGGASVVYHTREPVYDVETKEEQEAGFAEAIRERQDRWLRGL
jgi:PBSX family phage terminase large subunit